MFRHTKLLQLEAKPEKRLRRTDRHLSDSLDGAGETEAAPALEPADGDVRKLAIKRGTAHFVHTMDGRIGERRTYPRARS
ncbi:hypothetical protein [Amycolatopsis sp. NPDC003861]